MASIGAVRDRLDLEDADPREVEALGAEGLEVSVPARGSVRDGHPRHAEAPVLGDQLRRRAACRSCARSSGRIPAGTWSSSPRLPGRVVPPLIDPPHASRALDRAPCDSEPRSRSGPFPRPLDSLRSPGPLWPLQRRRRRRTLALYLSVDHSRALSCPSRRHRCGSSVAASARPRGATRWWCPAAGRLPGALGLHRLRDVGGVPGRPLHVRPVPLAVLLAGALRRLAARLVRAEAGLVAGVAAVLAGAADPAGSRRFRLTCYYYRGAYYKAFWADPPACAVGEPRKTLPRRELVSADPAERPPLLPLPRAAVPACSCRTTSWKALWFTDPATGHESVRHRRRHAGPGCSTSSCSAATRSAATRCGTSSAACVDQLSRRRSAQDGLRLRRAASTAGTCSGPGAACSRSASPTSTSASARWASGPTGGSSDARIPDARTRRPRHRRRRRGPARRDRGLGGRRVGRPGLQVAARQGAHRHGRGRHRGGARQRRRPRQLEGPLRRHDARRPVRQQLAHGRAARQGGARPRARARGLGRGLRPHARTAASCSATSAATAIRASRTSATAPAWR